jgi:hypothetical protein
MNKKLNTVLFILCATLFNILIAVLSFFVLTVLYVRFFMVMMPEANRSWIFTLIFLGSIAISFFVYRLVLKLLLHKVEIEKYFDPLFVKTKLKKN